MGYIPESIIDEVLDKADIESVVGGYVSFTKRSGSNLFGLCPFHSEKTPSFSINPRRGMYHCFGCNKGGNAIAFIMDMEHLTYPEAVRFLGKQYGVDVPETSGDNNSKLKQEKERVREILNEAGKYFHDSFTNSKLSLAAQKYVKKREISPETCKEFGLGYAPAGYDNLYRILHHKGYTDEEMINSGLFIRSEKNGKVYDLFHDRLMFPIYDSFGTLIAFGGRVLDDSLPKYVNSPNSLVYKKQEHFYGLNFAKKERSDVLIIVEGYMDTIAMHQAGVRNVVASLGTAFTDSQLRLAAKYAKEIVFFFDADAAGQKAAMRAIKMILGYFRRMRTQSLNVRIKIAKVPNAKDPDEYIREFGKENFLKVVNDAKDLDVYLSDKAYDDNFKDGKIDEFSYQQDIIAYGSWITDTIIRNKMATIAAPILKANSDIILNRMNDAEILLKEEDKKLMAIEMRQKKKEQKLNQTQLSMNDYSSVAGNYESYGTDLTGDVSNVVNTGANVSVNPTMAADGLTNNGAGAGGVDNVLVNNDTNSPLKNYVNSSIKPDLAYLEEIDMMILALMLGKELATEEFTADNLVITPDDFVGVNMKEFVKYILLNFDVEEGLDLDKFQSYLIRYTLNGLNAREVFLKGYAKLRKLYPDYGRIKDAYIKHLCIRRIAIFKEKYFKGFNTLYDVPPDKRAILQEELELIYKNIEFYQSKADEL